MPQKVFLKPFGGPQKCENKKLSRILMQLSEMNGAGKVKERVNNLFRVIGPEQIHDN